MLAEAATPPRLETGDTPVCRLRTPTPDDAKPAGGFRNPPVFSLVERLLGPGDLAGGHMHHHFGPAA